MNHEEVYDAIQQASPENAVETIALILAMVDSLNDRLGQLEAQNGRLANAVSCLRNGIVPD